MLIKLAVVKSKDCKVGEINFAKDIDKSKNRVKKMYSKQYCQELCDKDITVEVKEFELNETMSSYMIKDPYTEETINSMAILPFNDEEDAQDFINFTKRIPLYNESDLERAINLIDGELVPLPDAEVYW